jgi:hypothetical protein
MPDAVAPGPASDNRSPAMPPGRWTGPARRRRLSIDGLPAGPPAASRCPARHRLRRFGGWAVARIFRLRGGARLRAAGRGRGRAACRDPRAGPAGDRLLPGLPARRLGLCGPAGGRGDGRRGDPGGAARQHDSRPCRPGGAALGADGAGAGGGRSARFGLAVSRAGEAAADPRRRRGRRADERGGHAGRGAAGGVVAGAECHGARAARQHEPVFRHPDRGDRDGLRLARAVRDAGTLARGGGGGRPMASACGSGRRCSAWPARPRSAAPPMA